jgi:uncharacterized protein (DUF486 family)
MKRSSAVVFTALLAFVSMAIHITFGWYAFVEDAATHGNDALWSTYLIEWTRDTFENWQSEFIQLAFQFAVLAALFKRFGVQAHEEDQEQVKQELTELRLILEEIRGKQ